MQQDHESTREEIRLTSPRPDDIDAIDAAISLGNASRSTLGHMPFAAYYEAAAKQELILAQLGNRVVGYALFGLARGRVRLSHLCVDATFRGRGIARRLVGQVSDQHADYLGILVRCRRDYGLGDMWISLGFAQVSEGPGRSRDRHVIVNWWLDHGHPNLFTPETDTVLVRAAVDLNVLRDLVEPGRPQANESHALRADHLVDQLELVRTAALDAEIDLMEGPLRARCMRHAQHFRNLRSDPTRRARAEDYLRNAAQATDPGYPQTHQDRLDLQYAAEAVASDLNVLITRDEHLTGVLGPAAQQRGLRIMRPVDVVIHIDELARAEAYRPAKLLSTSYSQRLVGSGQEDQLTSLADTPHGERPQRFIQVLRNLATAGHDRVGIYDGAGKVAAAYCTVRVNNVMQVPLLRVSNNAIADTLARQLLFQLRAAARNADVSVIRLTDPHAPQQVRIAALNDGFRLTDDDDLYVFVLARVGPADEIEHEAVMAARRASLPEPAPIRSGMPALVAAGLERSWWPAKILDSELPSYLIPIQQAFSAELLGIPDSLIPRNDALGLNLEHVYYRSPGGTNISAPARLLWYMSEGGHSVSHPAGIVACSQLDTIVEGGPDDLHSRFQHLGVWSKDAVRRASRGGRVQALRFTSTEVFSSPISRSQFRQLGQAHGSAGQPPRGPLKISTALFAALYAVGQAH